MHKDCANCVHCVPRHMVDSSVGYTRVCLVMACGTGPNMRGLWPCGNTITSDGMEPRRWIQRYDTD